MTVLTHPAGRRLPKSRAIRMRRLRLIELGCKALGCLMLACSVGLLLAGWETMGAWTFVAAFFILMAATEIEASIRRLEWRQARDFWRLTYFSPN